MSVEKHTLIDHCMLNYIGEHKRSTSSHSRKNENAALHDGRREGIYTYAVGTSHLYLYLVES